MFHNWFFYFNARAGNIVLFKLRPRMFANYQNRGYFVMKEDRVKLAADELNVITQIEKSVLIPVAVDPLHFLNATRPFCALPRRRDFPKKGESRKQTTRLILIT